MSRSDQLTAQIEPFDTFWEGPKNVEKGYSKFYEFYKFNYLEHFPDDKNSDILVVSCGPGYCVNMLHKSSYKNVTGIDSRPDQVEWAKKHHLNCKVARAFEYLEECGDNSLGAIFCEQELNHLTKSEIVSFLSLCHQKLRPGGRLVCHSLNGANPIVGSESLAQNFDHYNTFTEYTFEQILSHTGYSDIRIFPLNLYVFWKNPANYILLLASFLLHITFRALFIMYGKGNRLFTKKIGASCTKPL